MPGSTSSSRETRPEPRRGGVGGARLVLLPVVGLMALLPMARAAGAPRPARRGTPEPSVRLKLASLGIPALSARLVNSGYSMLTVNVLDASHLLVTFATRDLVPRVAGDPATHDDRIVAGEIVQLPDGKVLARTTWHMHDHGRYLFPLGRGRFALRIGDDLSVMAPLRGLAAGQPFQRTMLRHQRGTPLLVAGAHDGGLLAAISELPQPRPAHPAINVGTDTPEDQPKPVYAVDFYRIAGDGTADAPFDLQPAGALRANVPLLLPMDADGYLWAVDQAKAKARWKVDFHDFNGKVLPVGELNSTCAPRLQMVSAAEFIALTCRGAEDRPLLLAMGLDGHETWEEPFGEFTESPAFQAAPAAGRFAMLRTSVTAMGPGTVAGVDASSVTNQEVRVYQTESGDLLLRLGLTPVFRVPENFSLAEDGRSLAVVEGEEIQVYALPAPSKRDLQDLADVAKFAPPHTDAPVTLAGLLQAPEKEPEAARGAAAAPAAAPAATATERAMTAPASSTTQAEVSAGGAAESGPDGQTGPRRRPTLLKPGEVPEFKDKTAPPQ